MCFTSLVFRPSCWPLAPAPIQVVPSNSTNKGLCTRTYSGATFSPVNEILCSCTYIGAACSSANKRLCTCAYSGVTFSSVNKRLCTCTYSGAAFSSVNKRLCTCTYIGACSTLAARSPSSAPFHIQLLLPGHPRVPLFTILSSFVQCRHPQVLLTSRKTTCKILTVQVFQPNHSIKSYNKLQ